MRRRRVARILGEASARQSDDASVQRLGHPLVVGAEEYGRMGRQRVKHQRQIADAGGVQAGVRFVQEHDVRFRQQGEGEPQALLHAAGVVAHEAVGIGCKAHVLEGGLDARGGSGGSAKSRREGEVFPGAEVRI